MPKSNNEKYLKAYLGNDYKKTKESTFSLLAFLLGPFYLLYKKMWLYGFLYSLLILIVSIYKLELGMIITVTINILLGIKWNQLYISFINEKIEEIKLINSNKSEEEIINICKESSKVPYIFFIGIALSLIIITIVTVSINLYRNYDKVLEGEIEKLDDNFKVEDLSYKIPKEYTGSNKNENNYKHYTLKDKDIKCSLTISSYNSYNMNIDEYIKNYIYVDNKDKITITDKIINNNKWKDVQIINKNKTENHYVIIHNSKVYEVKFSIYDETCNNQLEDITKSLIFSN